MKNDKTIFFTWMITFLFLMPFLSKAQIKDSVILAGRIKDKDSVAKPAIFECKIVRKNALYNWSGYTDVYKATLKDGCFKMTVPASDSTFYCIFNIEYANGKREMVNINNEVNMPFLLQKGDSIHINISSSGRVVFTGTGAAKLNCQQDIYELKYLPKGASDRIAKLYNSEQFEKEFKARALFLQLHLNMKLAILDSYKCEFPKFVYDLIYYDCIGKQLTNLYGSFLLIKQRHNAASAMLAAKKQVQMYLQEEKLPDTSAKAASLSMYYAECLLNKERMILQFNSVSQSSKTFAFKDLYEAIQNKYHSDLRDKLYLLAVLNFSGRKSEVFLYVDKILTQMGNNDSKEMLQEWRNKNIAGAKAYSFELPDAMGKQYVLNDFKGKVIVADFWFTGCVPCRNMAKTMTPIAQYYKENPNIIFLSINVDERKEKWELGLKDGSYTFPGAIHLSTFGEMRDAHPLLKFYNYNAFPQLLVIDKNGNIISAYPPDPRLDNGSKLKGLIDKFL